jgi:hypothetical protein
MTTLLDLFVANYSNENNWLFRNEFQWLARGEVCADGLHRSAIGGGAGQSDNRRQNLPATARDFQWGRPATAL